MLQRRQVPLIFLKLHAATLPPRRPHVQFHLPVFGDQRTERGGRKAKREGGRSGDRGAGGGGGHAAYRPVFPILHLLSSIFDLLSYALPSSLSYLQPERRSLSVAAQTGMRFRGQRSRLEPLSQWQRAIEVSPRPFPNFHSAYCILHFSFFIFNCRVWPLPLCYLVVQLYEITGFTPLPRRNRA